MKVKYIYVSVAFEQKNKQEDEKYKIKCSYYAWINQWKITDNFIGVVFLPYYNNRYFCILYKHLKRYFYICM